MFNGCGRRTKAKAYEGTGGSDKIISMCGHELHRDSKIEAARRRKVGLDCYSCHQSAQRLRGAGKLSRRQGSTCQGSLLPHPRGSA